jgi:4-hydroxybenzoate polyprenyltransferase
MPAMSAAKGVSTVSRAAAQESPSSPLARPLCVDLDGTLVKSDTLLDSLMVLVRTHPFAALMTPFWALQSKAALKSRVASRVNLDVTQLPYNHALVEFLKTARASGRRLYLVTGADQKLAARVADHLGLFDEVLASDGTTNLTGSKKLEGLRQRFGEHGYDYIGNGFVDLPLLQYAGTAMLANPAWMLRTRLRSRGVAVEKEFNDRPSWPRSLFKSIRLHQWAKNLLILLPPLLAHNLNLRVMANAVIAFFCFSLCASATYMVNDLLDIESDRRHPRKRFRAFAAGNLTVVTGAVISALFFVVAFAGAIFLLPTVFVSWLGVYLVATLSYSLYFKRVVLLDVLLLSGLYTLRVLAGGGATSVPISPWLSAFSIFLFLSLAMVKRFSELQNARTRGGVLLNGRGYLLGDIEQLRSFGTASAYAAVVVFSLYINGREMTALYHHPGRLWLITPLMILWLSRVWLLASRGELDEDPVIFAVTDRMSLLIGAGIAALAALAVF